MSERNGIIRGELEPLYKPGPNISTDTTLRALDKRKVGRDGIKPLPITT